MILNTRSSKVPIITDLNGTLINEFDFAYDDETEVDLSCSVTWQNEFYIFGGWNKRRQIAKIDGCVLRHIGELGFDQTFAGCANIKNEKILLCFNEFPYSDWDKCRSLPSPTGSYTEMPWSTYFHRRTKIAAFGSKLFESK